MSYPELIHPAQLIAEELAERGWKIYDVMLNSGPYDDKEHWDRTELALDLYMASAIRTDVDILMDDTVADAFGAAFGIEPKFFWALHDNWRLARRLPDNAK